MDLIRSGLDDAQAALVRKILASRRLGSARAAAGDPVALAVVARGLEAAGWAALWDDGNPWGFQATLTPRAAFALEEP